MTFEKNDDADDDRLALEASIERIRRLSEEDRSADAAALCTELIEQFPAEFEPYFRRAHAHWRLGDKHAAIRDLSNAIQLRPDEPALFYFRGLWSIEMGAPLPGTADLGKAIALDRVLGSTYYADCAPLPQAIGYLLLGEFELAKSAVDASPHETKSFIAGQLWTTTKVRELIDARRRP